MRTGGRRSKNRSVPRLLHDPDDSHHERNASCHYDQDSLVADSNETLLSDSSHQLVSVLIEAEQSSFHLCKTGVLRTEKPAKLAFKRETLSRKTRMLPAGSSKTTMELAVVLPRSTWRTRPWKSLRADVGLAVTRVDGFFFTAREKKVRSTFSRLPMKRDIVDEPFAIRADSACCTSLQIFSSPHSQRQGRFSRHEHHSFFDSDG